VNPDFGKLFGDLDFIVFFQNDPGLLLTVTQGDVMNFDGFGRFKTFGDFLQIIPGTDIPVIGFPGLSAVFHICLAHFLPPLLVFFLII
jgi:hypothetical protein